jgi:SecD/SecF fusion protein
MNLKKISSYLNYKLAAILTMALLLLIISLPSQYQPDFFPERIKDMKINLGLDLQGGSQLEYNIDLRKVEDADQKQIVDGVVEVINKRVNSLGVSEPNIYTSNVGGETHIVVELAGISDLEEAKNTVGKTIQLEFKEQNNETDPNLKQNVQTAALDLLNKIKEAPDNFAILSDQEQKAFPERVSYEETELLFADQIAGEQLRSQITSDNLEVGTVVPNLIEDSAGLTQSASGQLKMNEGFFILKLLEKNIDAERTKSTPKEVGASHILVSYKGAERADINVVRTKEEAKTLAEEVLAKTKAEGANFANIAKEFTDEASGKDTGGKLQDPIKEGGQYDPEFTRATLALEEANQVTDSIIETPFGYHIIKADQITPAKEEVTKETQYKFAKLLYSTAPDEWKTTELTGQYFVRADVTFDQFYLPQVSIQFDAEGARIFEELTERNSGKPIAIFVGGELISAPRVNEKISGGQAVINGDFNIDAARELARDLNTGAIPAPITLVGQYSIGASLGQEALSSSMVAGLIGILVLIAYMIAYYRVPGLIATLALSIYSILLIFLIKANIDIKFALLISLAVFSFVSVKIIQNQKELFLEKTITLLVACFGLFFFTFLLSSPVVLTLAGIAGVILSIGMAVDANVLIFERIKEEIQDGRPYLSAVETGFDRAWSSIRDSNFSSLITCAILYYFGTSIIRGFALNLAAGILISMFTAITVTKVVMIALRNKKLAENNKLMGFKTTKSEKAPFAIMQKSKVWLSISGSLVIISILSLTTMGLNLGLDFKGGTLMDLQFPTEQAVTNEQIQTTLTNLQNSLLENSEEETIWGNPSIVTSGDNSYIVILGYIDNETHDKILNTIKQEISDQVVETRFTTIGPTISQNLQSKAILSLLIALAAIIIYIAFSFRHIPKELNSWKFGASAIVAVAHDVIITLGVFSIFQFEVDALFITALLTIIGFSVHDTIVVFDRIRENLKGYDSTKHKFNEVCNQALTQTMARSINTSISTLVTLLALLIFGSSSIFLFVLALVIGIFIGTYSSIFTATPVLAYMINRSKVK